MEERQNNDYRNQLRTILMSYHMLEVEENHECTEELEASGIQQADQKLDGTVVFNKRKKNQAHTHRSLAKNIKCLDIRTMRMVLIKIYCPESVVANAVPFSSAKNNFPMIMKLPNYPMLPKIIREDVIAGYKVIIQDVPEGRSLVEIAEFSCAEALAVFRKFINLINYLHLMKITISEIEPRDLIVTQENALRIENLKHIYFNDDGLNEIHKVHNIRKVFNFIVKKVNENLNGELIKLDEYFLGKKAILDALEQKDEFVVIQKPRRDLFINPSCEIAEICNICNAGLQIDTYPTMFIDCLITEEIHKSQFGIFDCCRINDKDKKEYFIYRLLEWRLMTSQEEKYSQFERKNALDSPILLNCIKFLESFIIPDTGDDLRLNHESMNIPDTFRVSVKNLMSFLESNQTRKGIFTEILGEEHQVLFKNMLFQSLLGDQYISMILSREELLKQQIQIRPTVCGLLSCQILDLGTKIVFIELECLDIELWCSFFNILSHMNSEVYSRGSAFIFESRRNNLLVEARTTDSFLITFSKLSGTDDDFVRLISELIQLSKVKFTL